MTKIKKPGGVVKTKQSKPALTSQPASMNGHKSTVIYMNGSFIPKEQAVVSVFDHGLLYGDGVFEGIRAYNGRVFRLDEHLARLYRSARALVLDPGLTPREMETAVLDTLRANKLRDAYI